MNNRQINRLLQAMKKLCSDVNDLEICRRLETLMNTEKDDLPKKHIDQLMSDGVAFDPRTLQEPYTQYVRHYLYMLKRAAKKPAALDGTKPSVKGSPPAKVSAKAPNNASAKIKAESKAKTKTKPKAKAKAKAKKSESAPKTKKKAAAKKKATVKKKKPATKKRAAARKVAKKTVKKKKTPARKSAGKKK